jgi:hypothetical protein
MWIASEVKLAMESGEGTRWIAEKLSMVQMRDADQAPECPAPGLAGGQDAPEGRKACDGGGASVLSVPGLVEGLRKIAAYQRHGFAVFMHLPNGYCGRVRNVDEMQGHEMARFYVVGSPGEWEQEYMLAAIPPRVPGKIEIEHIPDEGGQG